MALRKMGAMAKPDCIITSDGKNLTIKTESTLKTTQFSCNLGEKFEETTADGRKTQVSHTYKIVEASRMIDGINNSLTVYRQEHNEKVSSYFMN